ncbi:hypothetical protein ACS0TY_002584 [Phlomoides rotata]
MGSVVLCIGAGILVMYFVESFDMVDSVYLSVMSVTTVGYGDMAFKTEVLNQGKHCGTHERYQESSFGSRCQPSCC